MKKIYFAGSIRGGRDDQRIYFDVINLLSRYCEVLTEHIGSRGLSDQGEQTLSEEEIYNRDMSWVREADAIVAEVTVPSLGVGYELGQAEAMGKPILCLYREIEGKRVSAMIAGNKRIELQAYRSVDDLVPMLENFLNF